MTRTEVGSGEGGDKGGHLITDMTLSLLYNSLL